MKTTMKKVDKETKEESFVDYVVDRDECNRPDTTLEGLATLPPVRGEGNFITAGNASQLSDGAAAVVLMSDEEASKRGLTPLGAFKGWAVAGCEPDEMGIGPVFAVPKLLARHNLKVDDIDLWELNEAFASQCLYSRDTLGIDPAKYNVNGGSIAIGHPFGMTGAALRGPHPARGHPPQGQVGRRHDVHRRRPGRSRPLRDLLVTQDFSAWPAPRRGRPSRPTARGASCGPCRRPARASRPGSVPRSLRRAREGRTDPRCRASRASGTAIDRCASQMLGVPKPAVIWR